MSEPYLGEIRLFAGHYVPQDWAECAGQILPINDYQALFSLIGTTFGGNGQTSFGLPDFRGRMAVHPKAGTNYVVGNHGGEETVTLTVNQYPSHSHAVNANGTAAGTDSPQGAVPGSKPGQSMYSSQSDTTLDPSTVTNCAGQGRSHFNLQPSIGLRYIISLTGLYPSFN